MSEAITLTLTHFIVFIYFMLAFKFWRLGLVKILISIMLRIIHWFCHLYIKLRFVQSLLFSWASQHCFCFHQVIWNYLWCWTTLKIVDNFNKKIWIVSILFCGLSFKIDILMSGSITTKLPRSSSALIDLSLLASSINWIVAVGYKCLWLLLKNLFEASLFL